MWGQILLLSPTVLAEDYLVFPKRRQIVRVVKIVFAGVVTNRDQFALLEKIRLFQEPGHERGRKGCSLLKEVN